MPPLLKKHKMTLPPYPKNSEDAWAGLTLDQIRMQRAIVQARMEIQKYKMYAQYQGVRERVPLLGSGSSLLSRVTGAFSWAEYAFMGFKLVRMITPLFRKRRK